MFSIFGLYKWSKIILIQQKLLKILLDPYKKVKHISNQYLMEKPKL